MRAGSVRVRLTRCCSMASSTPPGSKTGSKTEAWLTQSVHSQNVDAAGVHHGRHDEAALDDGVDVNAFAELLSDLVGDDAGHGKQTADGCGRRLWARPVVPEV